MSQFTFSKEQLLTLNQLVQALPLSERRVYLENLGETWLHLQRSEDFCVDERDYNIYSVVRIGEQSWLGENLRYKPVRYYENPENPNLFYGCLYDWAAVMDIDEQYNYVDWEGSGEGHRGIAPSGWHIPSDKEWKELEWWFVEQYNGGERKGLRGRIANRLKDQGAWGELCEDIRSGFDALPAGDHELSGFYFLGKYAYFWSSSFRKGPRSWGRYLRLNNDEIYRINKRRALACSCRCVKDSRGVLQYAQNKRKE